MQLNRSRETERKMKTEQITKIMSEFGPEYYHIMMVKQMLDVNWRNGPLKDISKKQYEYLILFDQPKKEYDTGFNVGDRVWHPGYGNGIVEFIDERALQYPVRVSFVMVETDFTVDGKNLKEKRGEAEMFCNVKGK